MILLLYTVKVVYSLYNYIHNLGEVAYEYHVFSCQYNDIHDISQRNRGKAIYIHSVSYSLFINAFIALLYCSVVAI